MTSDSNPFLPPAHPLPDGDPLGQEGALARWLLDHPVTLALLDGLGGHAVILDAQGNLLAASADALAALGPDRSGAPGAPFLQADAQHLADRGFRVTPYAIRLGEATWEIRVFQDIRGRLRHEEMEATFFQELLESVARLEALAAHPGRPASARAAALLRLRDHAAHLHMAIQTQLQFLAPQARTVPAEPAAAPGTWAGPEGEDERARVLVVDDSPMVRHLLTGVLSRANLRVCAAAGGAEALALAQETLPSLILLDAIMPEMDGFEVCARLKADERTRDIPVLFVTALREEADEVRALQAGAIDFITKPIHPAIVVARVHSHLELKRSKDRLLSLSLMDSLTGIANRRGFDLALAKEWQRTSRNAMPLSLLMGDVDFFKSYNDHFGHGAGDDCLRQVAGVFQGALHRPGDLAARYGGEEFMCILPETDEEGARIVAEQILDNLAALALPHPGSDVSAWVTVSIGLATVQPHLGGVPEALVDEADQAMYRAKRQGRNGFAQGIRPRRIRR